MRPLAFALSACVLLGHATLTEAQGTATASSAAWLPSLSVAVRTGAMQAPDSIASGWTRLHLEKEKGRHVVVLFRLREGTTPEVFLAALDTAIMTPSTGVAVGGPEVVSSAEVVMNLAPGRYVLACMARDTPKAK